MINLGRVSGIVPPFPIQPWLPGSKPSIGRGLLLSHSRGPLGMHAWRFRVLGALTLRGLRVGRAVVSLSNSVVAWLLGVLAWVAVIVTDGVLSGRLSLIQAGIIMCMGWCTILVRILGIGHSCAISWFGALGGARWRCLEARKRSRRTVLSTYSKARQTTTLKVPGMGRGGSVLDPY